jgi:hypothetical protein
MIKIRPYEHTDRFVLEDLIKTFYLEKKSTPPDTKQISETVSFYTSYSPCGKIYMIFYDNNPVGYCMITNVWRNKHAKISYFVEEIYINKNYAKYRLEVNLVDFLITTNNIHGICINFRDLSPSSKKVFKSIKFDRDKNIFYYKTVEI